MDRAMNVYRQTDIQTNRPSDKQTDTPREADR